MDPTAFVRSLDEQNQAALARVAESTRAAEPPSELSIEALLRLALRAEMEATELAARWLPETRDVEVRLALARQCGDEAKHYRLIADRLAELGTDPSTIDPLEGGHSPLFEHLAQLRTTVERVAAGQFTREALAVVRNAAFIELCDARGDLRTAELYRDIIQPDEHHHHELGRRLLLRLATTPEVQQEARAAARQTLELAEELQEIARLKRGITRAPGC